MSGEIWNSADVRHVEEGVHNRPMSMVSSSMHDPSYMYPGNSVFHGHPSSSSPAIQHRMSDGGGSTPDASGNLYFHKKWNPMAHDDSIIETGEPMRTMYNLRQSFENMLVNGSSSQPQSKRSLWDETVAQGDLWNRHERADWGAPEIAFDGLSVINGESSRGNEEELFSPGISARLNNMLGMLDNNSTPAGFERDLNALSSEERAAFSEISAVTKPFDPTPGSRQGTPTKNLLERNSSMLDFSGVLPSAVGSSPTALATSRNYELTDAQGYLSQQLLQMQSVPPGDLLPFSMQSQLDPLLSQRQTASDMQQHFGQSVVYPNSQYTFMPVNESRETDLYSNQLDVDVSQVLQRQPYPSSNNLMMQYDPVSRQLVYVPTPLRPPASTGLFMVNRQNQSTGREQVDSEKQGFFGGLPTSGTNDPGSSTSLHSLVQNMAPTHRNVVPSVAPTSSLARNALVPGVSADLGGMTVGPQQAYLLQNPSLISLQRGVRFSSLGPSTRSPLLESFRNNHIPQSHFSLSLLRSHVVEFAKDQHGSRFIQQKLERATDSEKALVFDELYDVSFELMTDVFGNYVIQKVFDFGLPEQKKRLIAKLDGKVLALSLQMYGCRVIQKAMEASDNETKVRMARELDKYVLKCVKDQNGNHVVQKCIETVPSSELNFMVNAFHGEVFDLSSHPYGCRVIQRILEHCTANQIAPIMKELHENVFSLIDDQYGNYVIQHVIEHGNPDDRTLITNRGICGRVCELATHKFASNVVEKSIVHSTRAERAKLVEEVLAAGDSVNGVPVVSGHGQLFALMRDQFANYVIQKILDVADNSQKRGLIQRIRTHIVDLRKFTYGKHIIAKMDRLSARDQIIASKGTPT